MRNLSQYWHALGDKPKAAIRKTTVFLLAFAIVLTILEVILVLVVGSFAASGNTQGALGTLGGMYLTLFIAFAGVIYGYVLVYRAHKAAKEWLFSLNAPGYPTRETWTQGNGWLLGITLLAMTGVPASIVFIPSELLLNSWDTLPGTVLWLVLGIVLPPIAAKRFVPVP